MFAVQLLTARPLGADVRFKIAVMPILVKGSVRNPRLLLAPRHLKDGAGVGKCLGGAGSVLTRIEAVELARPARLINVDSDACALPDGTDLHVVEIDEPSLLTRLSVRRRVTDGIPH